MVPSWCTLVGCIFAGMRHPTAGPFPCGAMGHLCVFRAVTVGELNMLRRLVSEPEHSLAGLSSLRAVPARQMGGIEGQLCSFVRSGRSQQSLDSPTSHLGLNGWTQPTCPKSAWSHRALRLPQTKSLLSCVPAGLCFCPWPRKSWAQSFSPALQRLS